MFDPFAEYGLQGWIADRMIQSYRDGDTPVYIMDEKVREWRSYGLTALADLFQKTYTS